MQTWKCDWISHHTVYTSFQSVRLCTAAYSDKKEGGEKMITVADQKGRQRFRGLRFHRSDTTSDMLWITINQRQSLAVMPGSGSSNRITFCLCYIWWMTVCLINLILCRLAGPHSALYTHANTLTAQRQILKIWTRKTVSVWHTRRWDALGSCRV